MDVVCVERAASAESAFVDVRPRPVAIAVAYPDDALDCRGIDGVRVDDVGGDCGRI